MIQIHMIIRILVYNLPDVRHSFELSALFRLGKLASWQALTRNTSEQKFKEMTQIHT